VLFFLWLYESLYLHHYCCFCIVSILQEFTTLRVLRYKQELFLHAVIFFVLLAETCSEDIESNIRFRNYQMKTFAYHINTTEMPPVLWCCWLGVRKDIWPVKKLSVGVLPCLGQGADLHMAKLILQPLTISCSSKSRLVLPFWYCLTLVIPGAHLHFIQCVQQITLR